MAASEPAFTRLGITDSTLLGLTAGSCALLTDDLKLYLEALRRGHDVINFTHYRETHGSI